MNGSVDDEVRADFLAEAGELLQALGRQLVELEAQPQDQALLNAIFRAFHTVKGGAGFLALTPVVELCHAAEDVFNLLRNGQRRIDAALMDAVLQSVDQLQNMLDVVGFGEAPEAAAGELLGRLHSYTATAEVAAAPATISEDEFEALLDQISAGRKIEPAAPPPVAAAPPAAREKPAAPREETTIRVDTHRLDRLMNLTGELVLVRNRLKALGGDEASVRAIRELDFIARDLQDAVMRLRMQPVGKVFSRFPKLARDVARGLGKEVEVEMVGEDTDLDKNLVEALADPLVHMVRNSVDHGIELPDVRRCAGKPAAGKLRLSARQEGDHIRIGLSDDGAGMDPDRLRMKAVEKGLLDGAAASRLSPEECLELVFMPGFSTRDAISDLSGRGVGMDVVKSAIDRLHGSIAIESKLGQGTSFLLRVPLTLAILPALMVNVGMRRFAVPLGAVAEVFALDPARLRRLDRWEVATRTHETLRLIHLDRWIGGEPPLPPVRHVVVVRIGEERYGLVVHEVGGREEVVIKPLGATLRGLAGLSGATVTPQGRVALILDLPGLLRVRDEGPTWTS